MARLNQDHFAADTETRAHYHSSMFGMRTGATPLRAVWAALFALLLAVRMLSPPGFMPAFDHGAVTIVVCPDSEAPLLPAGSMHHHHHDKAKHQSPCPYASASALGALGSDFGALLEVLIIGAALLLGRTFLFIERHGRRERPPLRGPPLPA